MNSPDGVIKINTDKGIGVNYEGIDRFSESFFADAYIEAFNKTLN